MTSVGYDMEAALQCFGDGSIDAGGSSTMPLIHSAGCPHCPTDCCGLQIIAMVGKP